MKFNPQSVMNQIALCESDKSKISRSDFHQNETVTVTVLQPSANPSGEPITWTDNIRGTNMIFFMSSKVVSTHNIN